MEHITQQLHWVRRAGRAMLVAQRVSQWVAAVVAAVVVLVTADYLLRFPGPMRLVIGLVAAGLAGAWLVGRLRRAMSFRPSLSDIALRAERLYPALAGRLTSAVDFAVAPGEYASPATTATLARHAIDEARMLTQRVPLRKLIDPTLTVRLALLALAALVVVAALALISPAHAATAAQRWLLPLGDAQWPRRVDVRDVTGVAVWPIDTALPLRAQVSRGDYDGLRVEATYRIRQDDAVSQRRHVIMTRVAPGVYETLVELGGLVSPGAGDAEVEFSFAADDDATDPARVALTARPVAVAVTVHVEPPVYAAGLVDPQTVDLHGQAGPIASAAALRGSRVTWTIRFNKPLPATDVRDLVPGLGADLDLDTLAPTGPADADAAVFAFTLGDTVTTNLALVDRHGLVSPGVRRYRVESIEDRPPNVALLEPATDEAVLPTAVVPVEAAAQDDVAVAHLSLEAAVKGSAVTLRDASDRRSSATLSHALDLAALNVSPGDNVTLAAVARDVYFEGADRPAARSGERHLRIIDDAQLVQQLRADLATVRQQALRMERSQRRLMEAEEASAARAEQAQLTQRLGVQRGLVRRLAERAQRNRLDEPALDQLLGEASRLLAGAQQRSAAADAALDAQQDARADQEAARAAMEELVNLLDQGQDALTLQLALRGLQAQQDQLAQQTRELLPQTVGRTRDELSQGLREQVAGLTERQRQLAEAANQLVRDMQSSAQALNRQGESDRDRAAAEALAEAAAIAQRQGLEQQMQGASRQIGDNQLSQAGGQQSDAQRTLAQMAEAVGSQQRRQAEMLRRRLMELAQLLEQLVERQASQLADLDRAAGDAVAPLALPLAQLRRSTLGAEEIAAQSQQTLPLTEPIGRAVNEQGRAVGALEAQQKPPAFAAETEALEQLRAALDGVRQQQREQRAQQAQQDRDRLRKEYERLAGEQEALGGRVGELLNLPRLDRRQQADLRAGEAEQAAIRRDADLLWSDVGSTLVFNRLHEKIDSASQRVERQLAGGSADPSIRGDQAMVAGALRAMAEALAQQTRSEQFDRPAGSGEGGGGGGGGSQSSEQAVPPLAELRLLRELQQQVYDTTRSTPAGASRDAVMQLADLQRELADLGGRLQEQARQQTGGPR